MGLFSSSPCAAGSTPRWWPLWVRRGLMVHAALIFLGSIHLGWHYAVDGYLAFALAYAVWRAMEPVARWWERSAVAQHYKTTLRVGG